MSGTATGASEAFIEFIATYRGVSDGESWNEFFTAWLEQGNAVLETGGDFGCYMQAVLFTVARYEVDPSILDYVEGGRYEFKGGERVRRRAEGFFVNPNELTERANLGYWFARASAFDAEHYRVIYAHRLAGVPNPWKEK